MLVREQANASSLGAEHYVVFCRAVKNLLRTDIALDHYAQLIDGLPTQETARDQITEALDAQHPVNQHKELCSGSLDRAIEFRENFTADDLMFDKQLLRAYETAPLGSKSFALRLIKLTACAVHQIGMFLFQQKDKLHDSSTTGGLDVDQVMEWETPSEGWERIPADSTLFMHPHFAAHKNYPKGIADIAGYWAEDRILGGVAIFDRSRTWAMDGDEPNVYFQRCRRRNTFRAWQLLDKQQTDLVSFLTSDDPDADVSSRLLPLQASIENKVRCDPEEAIPVHSIYRDLWERTPPVEPLRGSCVRRTLDVHDYPELDGQETTEEKIERMRRM